MIDFAKFALCVFFIFCLGLIFFYGYTQGKINCEKKTNALEMSKQQAITAAYKIAQNNHQQLQIDLNEKIKQLEVANARVATERSRVVLALNQRLRNGTTAISVRDDRSTITTGNPAGATSTTADAIIPGSAIEGISKLAADADILAERYKKLSVFLTEHKGEYCVSSE